MRLEHIVFHNLRRRKGRAIFLVIGLLIGVATVVTLLSLTDAMGQRAQHELENPAVPMGAHEDEVVPVLGDLAVDHGDELGNCRRLVEAVVYVLEEIGGDFAEDVQLKVMHVMMYAFLKFSGDTTDQEVRMWILATEDGVDLDDLLLDLRLALLVLPLGLRLDFRLGESEHAGLERVVHHVDDGGVRRERSDGGRRELPAREPRPRSADPGELLAHEHVHDAARTDAVVPKTSA